MVRKCTGLPLATVVLEGLPSRKKKLPSGWAEVLNNIAMHLSRGNEVVDAMLRRVGDCSMRKAKKDFFEIEKDIASLPLTSSSFLSFKAQ
ncbi:hypothetical protein CK203_022233 [Vitis vinifera]|uniref:NB-ARC domain-containing protein n=1 Tax=Vitis vinifera TaxID=29760 RepID=A0A438I901_VITVI|nr:hypothetical protein CK203_022233 [Vitis vinifera]